MRKKRLTQMMAALLIGICLPFQALADTGYFVWMEADRWQVARRSSYEARRDEVLTTLSESEQGYLIRNLQAADMLCLAVRDATAPGAYTVYRVRDDGGREALFSFEAADVFAFLGFRGSSVYFARRMPTDGAPVRTFCVVRSDLGQEAVLVSFMNRHWQRPSINARGEILFTSMEDDVETVVFLNANLERTELVHGSSAVWYDDGSFLYVRDGLLRHYDLTTSRDEAVLTENGQPLAVRLSPYVGDGLYLSLDRTSLVYAVEVEERYLGFIWSGYFYKCWRMVNLATGAESTVGHMPESYDNAMAF